MPVCIYDRKGFIGRYDATRPKAETTFGALKRMIVHWLSSRKSARIKPCR